MKAVTIKEISQELLNLTPKELRDLCLRLSRFKKENKELLTYLLFESSDEASYIENVKKEINQQFERVNKKSFYFIKRLNFDIGKIFNLPVVWMSKYSERYFCSPVSG